MTSKKSPTKYSEKYEPKATVRHAKIAKSRVEEVQEMKDKIRNDRYYAKNAEAERRKEIRKLPKEERKEARLELKEAIRRRKEGGKDAKRELTEFLYKEEIETDEFNQNVREEEDEKRRLLKEEKKRAKAEPGNQEYVEDKDIEESEEEIPEPVEEIPEPVEESK